MPIRPRMRIAEIAPFHESVPPRQYGGTERVVSYLTEELVARGHDVTLFASGVQVSPMEGPMSNQPPGTTSSSEAEMGSGAMSG